MIWKVHCLVWWSSVLPAASVYVSLSLEQKHEMSCILNRGCRALCRCTICPLVCCVGARGCALFEQLHWLTWLPKESHQLLPVLPPPLCRCYTGTRLTACVCSAGLHHHTVGVFSGDALSGLRLENHQRTAWRRDGKSHSQNDLP